MRFILKGFFTGSIFKAEPLPAPDLPGLFYFHDSKNSVTLRDFSPFDYLVNLQVILLNIKYLSLFFVSKYACKYLIGSMLQNLTFVFPGVKQAKK